MKPVHIDLGEIDDDFTGQWLDVRKPLGWTMRRIKQWQALETSDEDISAYEEFIRWLIQAWHIIDQDSGQWLNDPQTDDLGAITPAMLYALREAMKSPFRGGVAVAGSGGSDGSVADGNSRGTTSAG